MLALDALLPYARMLAEWPERRTTHVGFVGYGATVPGHRVLIAIDREYDPAIPEVIARALRERGARVDVMVVDAGTPERELDELDEVRVTMRRIPWEQAPRRWEGIPWIEELAGRERYDLLIHGKGGPIPKTPYRYEAVPWLRREHFVAPSTTYPLDLHRLVNEKTWEAFWPRGRGGRVHLTDPEGTDLTYTLWDDYYDGTRYGFDASPRYGHLFGHPTTPMIRQEDAAGVVAGTTSHFCRAFPRITVTVEAGQVVGVKGGGRYGETWEALRQEAQAIHYPAFPRPGLFWLWEVAIGTNPKIVRPRNVHLHGSGGFEWERRRSGIIHMGFGTLWRGPEERWAAEQGLLYGHLHIHLLFPTLDVITRDGTRLRVIERGHLTALDDPEVRQLAARFGDPDKLLREDWQPLIPGINAEGSYEAYARDPAAWIYHSPS
ncbi:MAG: hypothetical protein HYV08_14975 [Deltaproteobacteria bacterium]|nr:hypothetical protein [Deltaproteobacteria bacterium]